MLLIFAPQIDIVATVSMLNVNVCYSFNRKMMKNEGLNCHNFSP